MWIFFVSSFLYAQTNNTSIAAGASNVVMEYFCECKRVSNAGSQAIMVPHKTLAEFSSFYNNPPVNVTVNQTCFGGGSAPAYDFNNFAGTAQCPSRSNIAVVSGINNSTIVSRVRKTGLANCTVALKNYQAYAVANVTTSNTNFNVCQNDQLEIEISCGASGAQTGTVIFETSGGVNIDTVNVNFTSAITCF